MKLLKHLSTLVLIALLFVVSGCANSSSTKDNDETHVITDIKGNKVTVKKNINGVAITPLPWSAIVYAIDGSPDRIMGARKSTKKALDVSMLPKMAPDIEKINMDYIDNEGIINMEEIARIKPDAAIIWDTEEESKEQLEKLGIAPIMINSDNIENLKKSFMAVGQLMNKEDRAKEICDNYDNIDKYLDSKAKALEGKDKAKVLFLRAEDLQVQAFSRYVNDEVIVKSGGINVGNEASDSKNTEINMEQIYKWNPDIIFITNFDDVQPNDLYNTKFKGKDWSKISAIKNKQVYKTPIGIYRWDVAGVETPLMAKFMAAKINPSVFNDYKFEEDVKSFYKEFFNYDLTQEDIDFITNSNANKDSK